MTWWSIRKRKTVVINDARLAQNGDGADAHGRNATSARQFFVCRCARPNYRVHTRYVALLRITLWMTRNCRNYGRDFGCGWSWSFLKCISKNLYWMHAIVIATSQQSTGEEVTSFQYQNNFTCNAIVNRQILIVKEWLSVVDCKKTRFFRQVQNVYYVRCSSHNSLRKPSCFKLDVKFRLNGWGIKFGCLISFRSGWQERVEPATSADLPVKAKRSSWNGDREELVKRGLWQRSQRGHLNEEPWRQFFWLVLKSWCGSLRTLLAKVTSSCQFGQFYFQSRFKPIKKTGKYWVCIFDESGRINIPDSIPPLGLADCAFFGGDQFRPYVQQFRFCWFTSDIKELLKEFGTAGISVCGSSVLPTSELSVFARFFLRSGTTLWSMAVSRVWGHLGCCWRFEKGVRMGADGRGHLFGFLA